MGANEGCEGDLVGLSGEGLVNGADLASVLGNWTVSSP